MTALSKLIVDVLFIALGMVACLIVVVAASWLALWWAWRDR